MSLKFWPKGIFWDLSSMKDARTFFGSQKKHRNFLSSGIVDFISSNQQ